MTNQIYPICLCPAMAVLISRSQRKKTSIEARTEKVRSVNFSNDSAGACNLSDLQMIAEFRGHVVWDYKAIKSSDDKNFVMASKNKELKHRNLGSKTLQNQGT